MYTPIDTPLHTPTRKHTHISHMSTHTSPSWPCPLPPPLPPPHPTHTHTERYHMHTHTYAYTHKICKHTFFIYICMHTHIYITHKQLTSVLRAFLLKKALHDSHVMASKLWASALSPQTRQTFSSSRGRFLCFLRPCCCGDCSSSVSMVTPRGPGTRMPVALVRSITMARATASRSADLSGSESGSALGVWSRAGTPMAGASSMLGDRSSGVESGETGPETHHT